MAKSGVVAFVYLLWTTIVGAFALALFISLMTWIINGSTRPLRSGNATTKPPNKASLEPLRRDILFYES